MEEVPKTERRLAAILSADVHGYSRRMADDEASTVTDVKRCREIIDASVREHHGHIVDAPGDNVLAEFPSAVEAVQCGVEVQRELAARNEAAEPSRQMEFRIGIHVGDVITDGVQIYGDGVNIAARIEGLAQPGGICISREVHDQIRGKLDIDCEDLGERQVKNIPRPVRVLRVRMGALPTVSEQQPPSRRRMIIGSIATLGVLAASAALYFLMGRNSHPTTAVVPAPEPSKATVAVLPFANLSSDKNDEYFSDGMADEIIGELSKIAGMQVAAHSSSFVFKGKNEAAATIAGLLHVRNLLEGSVQRSAERLRIEIQLVDASSGFTLWSERYDEKMADVFQIQSDVAKSVANSLRVKLLPGVQARLERRPTENLEAYNLYLQGRYYLSQFSEDGWTKAVEAFNRAIEKDPNFALAYTGVADAYGSVSDFTMAPREAVPKSKAAAERALAIDDELGAAHGAFAFVLYGYDWNWPAAEREFKRGLELDPNNDFVHSEYGEFLDHMGRHDEALRETHRAYELNPLAVQPVLEMGWAFRDSHYYQRALESFQRATEMAPQNPFGYFGRGTVHTMQGDVQSAVPDFEEAASLGHSPLMESWLGVAYGLAGRRSDALKVLDGLKEQAGRRFVDPIAFVGIFGVLGDRDQAFQWMDKAYDERSYFMTTLKLPIWDIGETPLRQDPRFQAIYKKVGLPP